MSSSPGSHLLQIKFPLCHLSPGVLSLRDSPRSELALPPTHPYGPPASAGRTGLGACSASLGPRRPVSCLAHGRCPRSTGSPSLPRGALGAPASIMRSSRTAPRSTHPSLCPGPALGAQLLPSARPQSRERRWFCHSALNSAGPGIKGGHLNPRARPRPPPRPSCARRSRCRVAKGPSTGGQAPGGASKTPGVPADRGVFGIQETSDPTCAHARGRPPERARGAEGGLQRGGLGTLQ